jgi:adenylate cyclase
LQPAQIGVSSGTMRAGVYGSRTRLTYGALGDDVNLAARLMTSAAPGEILVTGRVKNAIMARFTFESRPLLIVKGKAEPQVVFAMTGARRQRAVKLEEPSYALPMLGRQSALEKIGAKLRLARAGQGQVIGITAEAGMGKSRLVAEVIRAARQLGFAAYGGACDASGSNSAYLVWKAIWQAFFDVDPTAPTRRQVRHLESEIEDRALHRLQAIPLLGPILDVPIDDNDFTSTLEPKDRRNILEVLLEDCVKAAANEEPILVVLEDVHWIDPLSHELLDALARATANTAVCFVLAYRPQDLERSQAPRLETLSHFTEMSLKPLTPADAAQLIRAKLADLFPERDNGLPTALVEQVIGKAQGNPFFIEELLNYLRDRGISPYEEQALTALELPSSLHTLILSRIDQLTEPQKATLKVASIIGRWFPFAWLYGCYPTLGTREAVKADLEVMARLDIVPLDTPEPELAYLFKHIVTQEVAYESLAHATRAQLHEQLAQYLEGQDAGKYLDRLAFHYGRSENTLKQREYFQKAGDTAAATFANEAALEYYARLLPLLTESGEQNHLRLRQGEVLELLGRWEEAEQCDRDALAQVGKDAVGTARCQLALGKVCRMRGAYPEALEWLEQARRGWEALQDQTGLALALIETGIVFQRKGDYEAARRPLEEGLALARELGDRKNAAYSLNSLGNVAFYQRDYPTALALYEESLALRREIGDKQGSAHSLHNLGIVARFQGDNSNALALYEESLALEREIGDKQGSAHSLLALGLETGVQGDYVAALARLQESLTLAREIGGKDFMSEILRGLGLVAYLQGDYVAAQTQLHEGLTLAREIGQRMVVANLLDNLGWVSYAQSDYLQAQALHEESLAVAREIGDGKVVLSNLIELAAINLVHAEDASRAAQLLGVAEPLYAKAAVALERFQRESYERSIDAAKAALGEAAFNTAFEVGQKMTLDEAINWALEGS